MRLAWLSLPLLAATACADPRLAPPEVARITPSGACGTGVVTLLIEGNHFDPDAIVDFPLKNMATGIEIAPENEAILTPRRAIVLHDQAVGAPATGDRPIVHDVRVINPDGAEARLSAGFTTYAPFTLTSLSPDRGPAGNTIALILKGTGLYGSLSLQIGVEHVASVAEIRPASAISATAALMIPTGTRPGTYALILRNAGGCELALDRAFTVE